MLRFIITFFIALYIYILIVLSEKFREMKVIHDNKLKRVALCISGQVRDNWEKTLGSVKKFIIDPLGADVYFHFSDVNSQTKSEIIEVLKPKDYMFEDLGNTNYYNKYSKNFDTMIKRMIRCNNMKKFHEDKSGIVYDIVIKMRPDMLVKELIPEKVFNKVKSNVLYCYEFRYVPIINFYGITDQFFLSDSRTMDKFLTLDIIKMVPFIKYCKYNEYILYMHAIALGIRRELFFSSSLLYKYINNDLFKFCKNFIRDKEIVYLTKSMCNRLNGL